MPSEDPIEVLPIVITKNLKVIMMGAAIIIGGVEMRLKVQDIADGNIMLAQALAEHESVPWHNGSSKIITDQAVQQSELKNIEKRLERVEEGQKETQDAVGDVLKEVREMRREGR